MEPDDHDLLISINAKLDQALIRTADHETRIRSLEKWIWGAAGVAGVAGATGASVIGKLAGG
jgi:hypothetical protein